jgi:hypothetical protein
MAPCLAPWLLAASALTAPALAAQSVPGSAPPPRAAPVGLSEVVLRIPGTVKDLTRDAAGRILYCTAEREVGRFVPGRPRTVLADAASGPFPQELRALAETGTGNVAVLEHEGNVRLLTGGLPPATLVYLDAYMIQDASDLIVDQAGNYLIASATPSNGLRGIDLVQANGVNWGYYLVRHAPLQLAHDPLTGGIVLSESSSGGNLRLIEPTPYRRTSPLDDFTHPGPSSVQSDGDVAIEADGDVYWIAGGSVYKHDRAKGTTALFASGFGQLRGVVIAAARALPPDAEEPAPEWSLYVAEGANPTEVREVPGVGAPAGVIANDQGPVPSRGTKINVTFGFQAFDLAADDQGRLLLGGTNWGSTQFVKRVTLTGTPSIATVASSANGLVDVVEGLCVAPDDSIYALARNGTIQRITEGPLTVTTVFDDPLGQIFAGKDLALDVDGTLYVATFQSTGFGKVMEVAGGGASLLSFTQETRGLAANPAGGMLLSQWHNSGFNGTVDLLHLADNSIEPLPGLAGINYSNFYGWGDGDICVDADGSIYTISEDDWSLIRYDPAEDAFVRFGSGYLNHPSGLAIAPSTAGSGSTTGWSLYVSEWDSLWEKPSVQGPASVLVDASLGLAAGRSVAGTVHPRYGKPRVLVPAASGAGGLIGTAEGWVLAFDPGSGQLVPLAGPDEGLRGDLVALAPAPDGRTLALNRDGELFVLGARRAREVAVAPELAGELVERHLAAPARTLSVRRRAGERDWFALDGWVVWRVGDAR